MDAAQGDAVLRGQALRFPLEVPPLRERRTTLRCSSSTSHSGMRADQLQLGRFQDPPPPRNDAVSSFRREHQSPRRDETRSAFDPKGWLAPILKRRATVGPDAFVFGSPDGEFQDSFKTAWESFLLVAHGHERKRAKPGVRVNRVKLKQVDFA
jgi:hypothetical protein